MRSDIDIFLETYEDEIMKQCTYIASNVWSRHKNPKREHQIQFSLIQSMVNRLLYFLDSLGGREEMEVDYKIKDFVHHVGDVIANYPDVVKNYMQQPENDWTKIEDEEIQRNEIEFQDKLMGYSLEIAQKLQKLNIYNRVTDYTLPIEGDKTLPFVFETKARENFPIIERYERSIALERGELDESEDEQ
jgi:hypothetical protein